MARKSSDIVATPQPLSEADDFKLIKGIGSGIESRLHRAGILTYAQLADLSPDEVADLVHRIGGLTPERIARENWTEQARELASKRERASGESPDEEASALTRQHPANFTVELSLDENNYVHHMRVVHVQSQTKDPWAGWDAERLVRFIVQRSGLRLPAPELVASPEAEVAPMAESDERAAQSTDAVTEKRSATLLAEAPVEEAPAVRAREAVAEEPRAALQLDVADLKLTEVPSQPSITGRALPKRIRAQADFQLSGTVADQITAEESPYAIQVLACELATGQTKVLAAAHERLRAGQFDYTTTVEFTLPPAGRYQVLGMVLLPHHNIVGASLGPVFRVVP